MKKVSFENIIYTVVDTVEVNGDQYNLIEWPSDVQETVYGPNDHAGMFPQPGVTALAEKDGKIYEISWVLDHPEEQDGGDWVDDWSTADSAELIGEVDAE